MVLYDGCKDKSSNFQSTFSPRLGGRPRGWGFCFEPDSHKIKSAPKRQKEDTLANDTQKPIHAKNKISGRVIPLLVLGFWDKNTGICAGAMSYRRDFPVTTRI